VTVPRWVMMLAALCLTGAAQGANTLSVRLVEASNSGAGMSAGLADVGPLLRRSLAFSNYRLLSAETMRLPVMRQTKSLGEYSVICSGPQNRLAITVTRVDRVMLTTQVNLQDGVPLILGGFSAGGGRHVLIFAAK
jgi:hypothetical protein